MQRKRSVEKPQKRGTLRRLLGREYFALKRKLEDFRSSQRWATEQSAIAFPSLIKDHESPTLRPLKAVDMYLQHNKVNNLRLATERLNGLLIKPGETFSFWRLVGRPTRKKGYLDGLVLQNGDTTKGVGGGLCQLGNMLYWMFLHSSLSVTERWRHSYDVFPDINRTLPFGCGATLAYNYIDLRVINRTSRTYQLIITVEKEKLCGELRANSEEQYQFSIKESDHRFQKEWWGGFTRHNRIWQHRTHIESAIEERKLITENCAIMMYNPLVEYDTNLVQE